MNTQQDRPITVVTGVIGVDAHVTGNWVINHALRDAGFAVIGLGVCIPQEEFVDAAVESNADAIWVTSMYGHALLDTEGLRDRCREAGIGDVLLYIGGMLVVGKHDWDQVRGQFEELGFDRAYPPNTLPDVAIDDVRRDLADRASTRGVVS